MAYNPGIQGNATQAFASAGPRMRANINAWQQQQAQDDAIRQFQAALAAQQANPNLGTGEQFPNTAPAPGGIPLGSGANPVFNSSPGAGIDYQAALKQLMGDQGEDSIFKKKTRSL
jgi:hypothetical protein